MVAYDLVKGVWFPSLCVGSIHPVDTIDTVDSRAILLIFLLLLLWWMVYIYECSDGVC